MAWPQQLLPLEEAVEIALQQHPLRESAQQRVESARQLTAQAGARPNPRLFIQSENWNFSGATQQPIASTFTDQFLYASQVIERGGKRARRVELGQAGERLTELDGELLARQIASQVKAAYWRVSGAQRVLELLLESRAIFQQSMEYHESQLREGMIAEVDVIRVRLEADRVEIAIEAAERELDVAVIALQQAMGITEFGALRAEDLPDGSPGPASTLPDPAIAVERALAERVEVHRAQQAVEHARSQLNLETAIAKPDLEVLAGYKRTVGFNTVMWGVQFNLPFFNKNQGNIGAAQADIRRAQADLAAAEAQVRAEVLAARRDVESRQQRLTGLLAESLATSAQTVEIARAAYREGGTDLLRLLDAERLEIELRVLNANLQMELQQSLVALETAMGVEP